MNAASYRRLHNRQKGKCTWCGSPVGNGRRTWCSQACVDAFRDEHNWVYIRRKIELRDRGVCSLCGCDTRRIEKMLRARPHWVWVDGRLVLNLIALDEWNAIREAYSAMGFDLHKDLWEADHIVPRILGGTHALSNLRTLCHPCHKAETARLAAERAAMRAAPHLGAARGLTREETSDG